MKKIVTIFVTPVVMLLLIILKFPSVEQFLKEDSTSSQSSQVSQTNNTNQSSSIPNNKEVKIFGKGISYLFMVQAFLVLATLFTYYVTMYSPYNKYEALAKKRWYTIDDAAKKLEQKYPGHVINFNIMIPRRKFFYFIEPDKTDPNKKKFTFTGKVFEVIWSRGECVNRKFRMTINQGMAGRVYGDGRRVVGVDLTANQGAYGNFNAQQIEMLKDVKMLTCSPIYLRKGHLNKQKIKFFGVLNVEGTSDGSETIVKTATIYNSFSQEVFTLSELCATLLE